jgi:hypothetical protein
MLASLSAWSWSLYGLSTHPWFWVLVIAGIAILVFLVSLGVQDCLVRGAKFYECGLGG